MTEFRIETLTLPAARLGGEEPLPRLAPLPSPQGGQEVAPSVPPEDARHFGYGVGDGWQVHRPQIDFDRVRRPRGFMALVLENRTLRATILPELGGRLWSLLHKASGTELLNRPPVFQPVNISLRGAWFAGGVEWNACVYGHSPFTVSPVFAAVWHDPRWGPGLRIYEWDRTRAVPFQIDFLLPEESPFLLARVRLVNPHAHTIPMYWWSNIAPRLEGIRVLAPADQAYTYEYWGRIDRVPVPDYANRDISYPAGSPYAQDYFYRVPDGARAWIAALDDDGRGLIQTSTARQRGRKLYVWGANRGGERWQDFLAVPGWRHLEIQAGLARTQMESLPMPPQACWEWMEAYGLMEADPRAVRGRDWSRALREVEQRLASTLPAALLEEQLRDTAATALRVPDELLLSGSGWGALERRRRERAGEGPFGGPEMPFGDTTLGNDQTPWLELLDRGELPYRPPEAVPGAWMLQDEWRRLLEDAVRAGRGAHWLSWLHLGLMYQAAGDSPKARAAWRRSLDLEPTPWALRNLAALDRSEGRLNEAADLYAQAVAQRPAHRALVVETCEAWLHAGRAADVLRLLERLPAELRANSRLRVLAAAAGLACGEPDHMAPLLDARFELDDLREGETTLSDLWFRYQEHLRARDAGGNVDAVLRRRVRAECPPPAHLDFRVVPEV